METRVQWVQKQPEMPGGSCSCCFHDVCTLCIVAFILRRGKKKTKNNSVNSPSAPTASISSHFHSQSVLNVSHPLSLSVCLPSLCQALTTQMYLPLWHCSNSLYSPSLKLYHVFVFYYTQEEMLSGGFGNVVMLFSRFIQIENGLSLNQGDNKWQLQW